MEAFQDRRRAISQYNSTPNLNDIIKDIKDRLQALSNAAGISTYTNATRPTASGVTIIYVSDASAGSRFQGWDSTTGAWVPLG